MAGGPYKRTNAWQIRWREHGLWQSESFANELDALQFKIWVERNGNHWPVGWIPGEGFSQDAPPPVGQPVTRLRRTN